VSVWPDEKKTIKEKRAVIKYFIIFKILFFAKIDEFIQKTSNVSRCEYIAEKLPDKPC
jgi:preprotein translocase subunit SecE